MSLDITADTVLGLDKREANADGTFAGRSGAAAGAPAGGGRSGGFDDTEIDELPF